MSHDLVKECELTEILEKICICELPDDILVHVLSLLTLKEAGRTSLLSKRWTNLWMNIPTLNFDSAKIIHDLRVRTKSLEVEVPKYLYWVSQVMNSHKAATIDEFRVRFDIPFLESNSKNIDDLFRFAVQKRVKRLQVDLSVCKGFIRKLHYTFPSLSCNSLTSLELACVDVTGEVLESLLCDCLALECLSVKYSKSLVALKVVGPSLILKSLTVYRCYEIKELEISAPNLVSVSYFGPKIRVLFNSVPKLSDISIGCHYANDLVSSFSDLSSYFSQIEVLTVRPFCQFNTLRISPSSIFTRLAKLDMEVKPEWDDDLCFFESLLKSCPLLHHFKLQLWVGEQHSLERDGFGKQEACPHLCIKILEIVGFVGYPIDLEIATMLIESAVFLDKIIVDPTEMGTEGSPWEFNDTPKKIRARKKAMLLQGNLKPNTKLEIL